jgi:hypothetical protein
MTDTQTPNTPSELEVILSSIDELLGEDGLDEEEALEVAALAGLAQRLGAPEKVFQDVRTWIDEQGGRALLDAGWEALDLDDVLDPIEGLLGEEPTDEAVEEAIWDFDELVAAAVFDGRLDRVRKAVNAVERLIRLSPETFACLAPDARVLARDPRIAANLDAWAYWLALADADAG